MSERPSFEAFDYLLRSNKGIERRLIFDALVRAKALMGFDDHEYVGFGSISFGDFRLAHRLLGLERMLSIEYETHADRATFNTPYRCIEVVAGTCKKVLSNFTGADWSKPKVAWFDYDGLLNDDVCREIEIFVTTAAVDSILIVTLNGQRKRYRKPNGTTFADTSIGVLESMVGKNVVKAEYAPTKTKGGAIVDVPDGLFPEALASTLLNFMRHKVTASGRREAGAPVEFVPLFNLSHQDGAQMITVGGAIAGPKRTSLWRQSLGDCLNSYQADGNPGFVSLDLVPITIKEKLLLDSCLPHIDSHFLTAAKKAGIAISDPELLKYRRFYKHLPVYVESSL